MTGDNFTPYAHVLFDGDEISTQWIDSHHIQILEEVEVNTDEEDKDSEEKASSDTSSSSEESLEDIPNAFLVQIQSDGGTVLGESNALLYQDTSLAKTKTK